MKRLAIAALILAASSLPAHDASLSFAAKLATVAPLSRNVIDCTAPFGWRDPFTCEH